MYRSNYSLLLFLALLSPLLPAHISRVNTASVIPFAHDVHAAQNAQGTFTVYRVAMVLLTSIPAPRTATSEVAAR
jgi:hypothetical protein